MVETETKKPSLDLLLSHYVTLALLILLLDKLDLSKAVKKHCETGLNIAGIIYADRIYKKGAGALSGKEFDAFFKMFPKEYFNNRESISDDLIMKNIKICMTTNDIVHIISE